MTSIVTVCTGNICRSPAAALLLRDYLGDLAEVSSAGTHALEGHPIPHEMLTALDGVGLDGRAHRARALSGEVTRGADLIIAMAGDHRAFAVRQAPAALKRTVLLDELARAAREGIVLEGSSAKERLGQVAATVAAHRTALADPPPRDVPDPYRRGQGAYDDAFTMIHHAVRDVAAWVRS
ncbi:MAG: low molecular weight phosphatase family protein [Demequina sp.]|uniref:arsenate-mycothiol transferase ArsC n=1 Tax=Demequina sp. TaxID=2050685 RepID=UPI003A899148